MLTRYDDILVIEENLAENEFVKVTASTQQ